LTNARRPDVPSALHETLWLEFHPMGHVPEPGRRAVPRTKRWLVVIKANGASVGVIVWSTAWRRYVIDAVSGSVQFDAICLRDIASFLDARTAEQRATWKPRKA